MKVTPVSVLKLIIVLEKSDFCGPVMRTVPLVRFKLPMSEELTW